MRLLDVIKRPVIAEKSVLAMNEKKYIFKVSARANETLVKQTVRSVFDAKVANVSILNVRPKLKRMGKYTGCTKRHRKVIVTLTEDSKEIQLFEAAE